MGRQKELTGIERPKIAELEALAEVYTKSRDKRMRASKAEKADKDALIAGMQKHKLSAYRCDDGEVVTTSTRTDVKVTTQKEEGEESEGDDPPDASGKAS